MIYTVLQLLVLFAIPIALHNYLKHKAIAKWLSPVVVCYIIGICIGTFMTSHIDVSLSQQVMDISIVLAIPLLLMTSNFIEWLPKAKGVLGAFFISVLSVLMATLLAFFIFRSQTDEAWMISGMVFAGFTGTSPNLNAVAKGLNCPENTLLLTNLGDIISSGVYLIILTSVAQPILSRILTAYKPYSGELSMQLPQEEEEGQDSTDQFGYLSRYRMKRVGIYLAPVLISMLILAVTMLAAGQFIPEEEKRGTFIILSVTVLGIAVSFIPAIRNLRSSYTIGQYLLLVFCMALGSLINADTIMEANTTILTFVALIMIVTIIVNILLAYIFKIDVDTTIITSTSTIFGPAFIGQVAMSMKNKEIIFSGMIASMVGIALGNFLGIGLARILQALG